MELKESQMHASVDSTSVVQTKAASAPTLPLKETQLKSQISAPSYLFSLKENELPPFVKPGREARPELLIGKIFNEEEVVAMIGTSDSDPVHGLKRFISEFLIQKQVVANYNLSEKNFLVSLLTETIDYAAQRDFSAYKLACLLTIYLSSHLYFKWYYWSAPAALWAYFKELMIRHTIEDTPNAQEVFGPEECYDIMSHFHGAYITNLPLIHIATFRAYRLKFLWPFKPK